MIFNSPQIQIDPSSFAGDPCLYFHFSGKFTEEAANEATEAWHEMLTEHPLLNYVFIWDCTLMSGFEMAARKQWYNCMSKHKHQIARVVVISGSVLIRSAAKVMLEFFGLPYSVIKTVEQLKEVEETLVEV